jgi:hypothetical protein
MARIDFVGGIGSRMDAVVAILTPLFAIAAGWLAGIIAQWVPGAHLDQSQIVAFMAAAAAVVIPRCGSPAADRTG